MDNQKIKQINTEIINMKDEYINEMNTVNHHYWPIIAKYKKSKKMNVWLFSLACCLLFSICLWLLLTEVTNEYWIILSLGTCFVILFLTTFFMSINIKKIRQVEEEWKKALAQKADGLKIKIMEETQIAIDLMMSSFGDEKDKIKNEIGLAYDDVLDYYNHWVENN